jgi:hypothetical protein
VKLKSNQVLLIFSLCLLVGLSCNILQTLSPDSDSNGTKEPDPTNFIVPTVVPSPVPSEPCPVPASSTLSPIGAESFDIVASISEYLNTGGTLDALEDKIEELALLIQETPAIIESDFNGDGFIDLVVSILLPSEEVYPLSGQSHVYLCQEGGYELVYSTPQSTLIGLPRFYSTEDITGDGLTDLVLGIENCGAHTCFTSIEGLTWTGDSFENRLQGSSEDLPSPLVDINKNPTEIVVTGEGVASVGAGPNRSVERKWHWDENLQSFIPVEDKLLPSSFRIHVLHDADQAMLLGQVEAAVRGYTLVRVDGQLLEWVDPEKERANLAAYAGFKMILAHILEGDLIAAESALEELLFQYPEGETGAAFGAMAETFWDEYLITKDVETSCLTAQAFADENSVDILDVLYFGYANPAYSSEDLCPVLDSITS